jgi:hypothetical protein
MTRDEYILLTIEAEMQYEKDIQGLQSQFNEGVVNNSQALQIKIELLKIRANSLIEASNLFHGEDY